MAVRVIHSLSALGGYYRRMVQDWEHRKQSTQRLIYWQEYFIPMEGCGTYLDPGHSIYDEKFKTLVLILIKKQNIGFSNQYST
jgi:hypothetical protein